MPTLSAHVPDDWEFRADFDMLVEREYRGKPGPYIRELIEHDITSKSRRGDLIQPDVIVELTRRLMGELDAEEMQAIMATHDQRKILRTLLRDVLNRHTAKIDSDYGVRRPSGTEVKDGGKKRSA